MLLHYREDKCQGSQCRQCSERSTKGGGSGGWYLVQRDARFSQKQNGRIFAGEDARLRRSGRFRRGGAALGQAWKEGHAFRVQTPLQSQQESLDAPAVARPPLYRGAGNVSRMRIKRARGTYRSHSTPRSSTPGSYRKCRPQPTNTACSRRPCTCTLPLSHSTGRGAPDAGACPRLQQTRPADPLSA